MQGKASYLTPPFPFYISCSVAIFLASSSTEVSHLFFLLPRNQSVQSRLEFLGISCLSFPIASCYMASIAIKLPRLKKKA